MRAGLLVAGLLLLLLAPLPRAPGHGWWWWWVVVGQKSVRSHARTDRTNNNVPEAVADIPEAETLLGKEGFEHSSPPLPPSW